MLQPNPSSFHPISVIARSRDVNRTILTSRTMEYNPNGDGDGKIGFNGISVKANLINVVGAAQDSRLGLPNHASISQQIHLPPWPTRFTGVPPRNLNKNAAHQQSYLTEIPVADDPARHQYATDSSTNQAKGSRPPFNYKSIPIHKLTGHPIQTQYPIGMTFAPPKEFSTAINSAHVSKPMETIPVPRSLGPPLGLPMTSNPNLTSTQSVSDSASTRSFVPLLRPTVPIYRRRGSRITRRAGGPSSNNSKRIQNRTSGRCPQAPVAQMSIEEVEAAPQSQSVPSSDYWIGSQDGTQTLDTEITQDVERQNPAQRHTRTTKLQTNTSAGNTAITRDIPSGGAIAVKSGLAELISVTKEIRSHLISWREQDARRQDMDRSILLNILECAQKTAVHNNGGLSPEKFSGDKDATFDIVATVNIAQSFVKLHTLLGFDPNSDTAQIYAASADPKCPVIRSAARFALRDAPEDQLLTFLNDTLPSTRRSAGGCSVLSTISRGQSRAHECVQRDIVATFLQFCPEGCPLRTTSPSSAQQKAVFAKEVVQSSKHKTDPSFNAAWFHACQIAQIKAGLAAQSTFSDLRNAMPDSEIEALWMKSEDNATAEKLQMTVCSFAFVVTKVTFALQRLFASTAMRKELKKSHQVPWAVECLRIDEIISSQDSSNLRLGRITFPSRLSAEIRTTLSALSSPFNSSAQSS